MSKYDDVAIRVKELESRPTPILSSEEEAEGFKVWNLWMEGYVCTGMDGIPAKAIFLGSFVGKTFIEAVSDYGRKKSDIYEELDVNESGYQVKIINGVPSYWGCRIFDNEDDARKRWG